MAAEIEMPLQVARPTPLSLTAPERQSSPELGSPSKLPQYNKKTGRPIRKSAGKLKKAAGYVAGYVDSSMLEIEDDYESSISQDSEDEGMHKRSHADKKKRRRRRSPSLPSPRLEPMVYSQELDELTDDETGGAFHRNTPKKPPITLQFNVPLGYHGPLFVKLDSALLKDTKDGTLHDMHQVPAKRARTGVAVRPVVDAPVRSRGFSDLPPELRNCVYRYAFVRSEVLEIPQNSAGPGLCQSGQFLRTCKLVHDEGCSVLYGENEFHFSRHHDTRAPFWEPKPKEIGYQDALHFVKMIGPENIQYLRDIRIDFDDALPKHAPNVNIEGRRFLVDDYLMNFLRILRDAKLRKLTMTFYGRRQIFRSDIKFLGYLEQIKADEVVNKTLSIYHPAKLSSWLWAEIKEQMVRKRKLYENK